MSAKVLVAVRLVRRGTCLRCLRTLGPALLDDVIGAVLSVESVVGTDPTEPRCFTCNLPGPWLPAEDGGVPGP